MVFTPDGNQHWCRVYRDDEKEALQFAPAEAEKATHLLGIALGMESLEVLPDHIAGTPFVIRFLEEGFCRIEREDGEGSLRFLWEEGDELIVAIKSALGICINVRTLGGPAGAVGHQFSDNF
jgi:hypothetical protein